MSRIAEMFQPNGWAGGGDNGKLLVRFPCSYPLGGNAFAADSRKQPINSRMMELWAVVCTEGL